MKRLGFYTCVQENGKEYSAKTLNQIALVVKNATCIRRKTPSDFVFDTIDEVATVIGTVLHVADFETFTRYWVERSMEDFDDPACEEKRSGAVPLPRERVYDWLASKAASSEIYGETTKTGYQIVFAKHDTFEGVEDVLRVIL